MRRKEKEITDDKELISIIEKAEICRLAMIDEDQPYLVPMNFGYKDNVFYFHSAREGKKIDLLRKNPRVCLEIESDTSLIKSETPCDWSMKYRSIIARGSVEFIDDPAEKKEAFHTIMHQYSPGKEYSYTPAMMKAVTLFRLPVREMRGKQSGFNKEEE